MEEQNKIDQLFRERLRDAEVKAPEFVWPEVERRLHPRRKKVLFFWIFLLAFGLLGWGAMRFGRSQKDMQANLQKAQLQQNLQENGVSTPQPKAASIAAERSTETAGEKTTQKTAIRETVPASKGLLQSKGRITGEKMHVSPLYNPTRKAEKDQPELSVEDKLPLTAFQTVETAKIDLSGAQVAIPEYGLKFLSRPTAFPLLESRELLRVNPHKDRHKNKFIIRKKKPNKHCYDFSKNSAVWIVDLYGGPALARKKLSARPDDKPYLNQRLSTESNSLSYNLGFRATYMFNKQFMIRSGLHLDQINEIFEYTDPTYTVYTIKVNPNGTVDTLAVNQGANYQKTFNRFMFLDVPLQGGFELRRGRGGMNLTGGVSFNVMFRKRGAIITPQEETAYFTPGEKGSIEIFKPTAIGMSLMGSVQWFYYLQPRTRVFIEPYYRKMLNPVNLLSHPIQQKYGIGGLRMGISKLID